MKSYIALCIFSNKKNFTDVIIHPLLDIYDSIVSETSMLFIYDQKLFVGLGWLVARVVIDKFDIFDI